MVKVTNYAVRERKDGTTFIALEITGGLEIQQSQTTGNFYATVKKCSIPSTFDENIMVNALRIDNVPGTHIINYFSDEDSIAIKHTAHNRNGFALGAVIAAEKITNTKGFFEFRDLLFS